MQSPPASLYLCFTFFSTFSFTLFPDRSLGQPRFRIIQGLCIACMIKNKLCNVTRAACCSCNLPPLHSCLSLQEGCSNWRETLRPLKVCAALSPPSHWLFLLSPLASFETQTRGSPCPLRHLVCTVTISHSQPSVLYLQHLVHYLAHNTGSMIVP